ncbi:MAG: GNAT family N-acetyltransferase [Anaerolineae bacterium]|nr:GNAT family N-acetyltransferase [Anaerolineae bacterium]
MSVPTIETAQLILRPFQPEDADAYAQAVLANPTTARALPTNRPVPPQRAPSIIEGIRDHWEEFSYGLWAVIHRETGQLIGHCGLQRLGETARVELTYAIEPEHVSGGLPLEATSAALRYGFESLHIAEILAVILPENSAARRVYSRLGMNPGPNVHVYEQHLPSYSMLQGDFLPDESPYRIQGASHDSPSD